MGASREIQAGKGRWRCLAWAVVALFALLVLLAPDAAADLHVPPIGPPGPPPHPPAFTATTAGATASFTIGCPASPPGSVRADCVGRITLTAHKLRAGRSFTLVSPGSPGATNVVVGSGGYLVAPGFAGTVGVSLNHLGRHLLARFYKFPATATATGAVRATLPLDFAYGLVKSTFMWAWAFTATHTTLLSLEVLGMPPAASVLIVCHGGGCPFVRRTVAATGNRISLTSRLKGARLRPGSTLWVAVNAPNDVGRVALFRIASGQSPTEIIECLPPGTAAPVRCRT